MDSQCPLRDRPPSCPYIDRQIPSWKSFDWSSTRGSSTQALYPRAKKKTKISTLCASPITFCKAVSALCHGCSCVSLGLGGLSPFVRQRDVCSVGKRRSSSPGSVRRIDQRRPWYVTGSILPLEWLASCASLPGMYKRRRLSKRSGARASQLDDCSKQLLYCLPIANSGFTEFHPADLFCRQMILTIVETFCAAAIAHPKTNDFNQMLYLYLFPVNRQQNPRHFWQHPFRFINQ